MLAECSEDKGFFDVQSSCKVLAYDYVSAWCEHRFSPKSWLTERLLHLSVLEEFLRFQNLVADRIYMPDIMK